MWSPGARAATYSVATSAQLVAALGSAGAGSGASTVTLRAGSYAPGATLTITGDVTIDGPAAAPGATLSGAGLSPLGSSLFAVAPGGHATFNDLSLTASGYASQGAAIDDAGVADIQASTFSGNEGPALLVEPGATATVTNSTVSSNLDGGIEDEGSATLADSTVANNAIEGIENSSGELSLVNTIVAGNAAPNCSDPASTADHSLDSDGTCGVGTLGGVNPQLGPLSANGGPTLTQVLGPTSPAIGAGDPSRCPTADQRGYPLAAGACDIGAYQSAAKPASGTAAAPSGGDSGSTPTTGAANPQPAGASPGKTPPTPRRLVGVDGRGAVRGRRGAAAAFTIAVSTTRPHGTVSYHDAGGRVWLRSASVSSVSVNSVHGTVTAVGTAINWAARHARIRFTATASESGSTHTFTLRLSSGYAAGGRLLHGTLVNVTRA